MKPKSNEAGSQYGLRWTLPPPRRDPPDNRKRRAASGASWSSSRPSCRRSQPRRPRATPRPIFPSSHLSSSSSPLLFPPLGECFSEWVGGGDFPRAYLLQKTNCPGGGNPHIPTLPPSSPILPPSASTPSPPTWLEPNPKTAPLQNHKPIFIFHHTLDLSCFRCPV